MGHNQNEASASTHRS